MKVQREDLGNCQVQLTVEVDNEQVEEAKKKAARKLARDVNIPGFRRGKAPYSVLAQTVGESTILQEALQEIFPSVLDKAIEESEVEVYSYQGIDADVESMEPLTLRFTVPTMPEVTLGDVDQVSVEPQEAEVEEERIDEALENLRQSRAVWEPSNESAQFGDRATIDLEGTLMTGEQVTEQQGMELTLIDPSTKEEEDDEAGEGSPEAPDIGEQIVGMIPNQVKEFPLVYPEDWPEQKLAGRTVLYKATLLDLKRRHEAELNDEFAQEVGEFDTLEELRERIRSNMESEAEQETFNQVVHEILDALADESELNYPEAMVDQEVERRIQQLEQQLGQYGMNLEQYLNVTGKERSEIEEEYSDQAEEFVVRSLVLSEYVKENEITATEEEIEREIDTILASYDAETAEGVRERIRQDPEAMNDINNGLVSRKAIYDLYSRVTGEEAPPLFPEKEEESDEEVAEKPAEGAVAQPVDETDEAEADDEAAPGVASSTEDEDGEGPAPVAQQDEEES